MTPLPHLTSRLAPVRALGVAALLGLAACTAPAPRSNLDASTGVITADVSPAVAARYQAVQDGDTLIPGVSPGYLTGQNARTEVYYSGPDEPGTIVVDPYARVLYYIEEGGRAMRYGIAVGREGYGFSGDARVGDKREWPYWAPTKNMVRRDPEIYGPVAAGLPGGLENPLGARALYLHRGKRDTFYRIHGTNNAFTIGRATSAGCIRLFNQDIIDLYSRADRGSFVHVRTREESAIAEDPMVENAHGLMVPLTSFPPDVQAQIMAGNIPWPKYVPPVGLAPASSDEAQPTLPDGAAADPDGVFQQIN